MSEIRTAIGMMSGTSMDGIDIALLRTDGDRLVEAGPTLAIDYEAAFRKRLEAGLNDATAISARHDRPGDLDALEAEITSRHVAAVGRFLNENGLDAAGADFIGFHGQTVIHRPDAGYTVQLGDGQRLASETGITTVWDMRANDMVHGGQGAPLVPVYHAALAEMHAPDKRVAFVNIGGISNATLIAPGTDPVALDCGPGNTLIDQWMLREAGIPMDDGGRIAAEGSADANIVGTILDQDYFAKAGPKSLDRASFSLAPVTGMELSDGAATLASLTASSILKSFEINDFKPELVIVSGGGARNGTIMRFLEVELYGSCDVLTSNVLGIDSQVVEAQAWAYLAVRASRGLPLTFPTTTGCRTPVSGGIISKPLPGN